MYYTTSVEQGNGSAVIFEKDARVFTFSLHCTVPPKQPPLLYTSPARGQMGGTGYGQEDLGREWVAGAGAGARGKQHYTLTCNTTLT